MRRNREDGSCVRTALLGAAVALVLAGVSPALAQTAPDGEAPPAAAGAGGAAELAKELSNPVASLVSIPFLLNWDEGLRPEEEGTPGSRRGFLSGFGS